MRNQMNALLNVNLGSLLPAKVFSDFVLKIGQDRIVANEIKILAKIRGAVCIHLPELMWTTKGNDQLGIVPVGTPIDFRQIAHISC
jgi:hypothetical protein